MTSESTGNPGCGSWCGRRPGRVVGVVRGHGGSYRRRVGTVGGRVVRGSTTCSGAGEPHRRGLQASARLWSGFVRRGVWRRVGFGYGASGRLLRVRRCLRCSLWSRFPLFSTDGNSFPVDDLGSWDKPCGYRLECRWPLIRYPYVDLGARPRRQPCAGAGRGAGRGPGGWRETLWSARSDDELVEVVARVQQLTSALAAVEAGAVAEADARDLAKQRLHYGSTGDWLTQVGGLSRGEGKRRVVRARALTGPLARTRQGSGRRGRSRVDQADVIVRAVDDLPCGDLVRRRGEKLLVRQAGHLDATELARAGRHLVEVVDPDGVDRRLEAALERQERAAHLTRYLSISPDRAGGVRVKGRGTAEDGALLMAALLPLTCPDPKARPDPGPGDRGGPPRPPRPRRPALGRPGHHRPPRARTPTCRRRPTAPPPDSWSPSTSRPSRATSERRHRGRDQRRRHRTPTRNPASARV